MTWRRGRPETGWLSRYRCCSISALARREERERVRTHRRAYRRQVCATTAASHPEASAFLTPADDSGSMNEPASPTSSQPSPAYSRASIRATHPSPTVRRSATRRRSARLNMRVLRDLGKIDILATIRRARGPDRCGSTIARCAARRAPSGTDHIHPSSYDSIERVRVVRHLPRAPPAPFADQRHRARPVVVTPNILRARDHAGSSGAIERESAAEIERVCRPPLRARPQRRSPWRDRAAPPTGVRPRAASRARRPRMSRRAHPPAPPHRVAG